MKEIDLKDRIREYEINKGQIKVVEKNLEKMKHALKELEQEIINAAIVQNQVILGSTNTDYEYKLMCHLQKRKAKKDEKR